MLQNVTHWAKTIKKNTNSTQNKFQTHRAKQYEVTSFLSTDCELSTETCSKNVYSLGPLSCLLLSLHLMPTFMRGRCTMTYASTCIVPPLCLLVRRRSPSCWHTKHLLSTSQYPVIPEHSPTVFVQHLLPKLYL